MRVTRITRRIRSGPLTALLCIQTLILMALAPPALAASGDLDPSFGSGGTVTTAFGPSYDPAYDIAIQDDGKIVVAGARYEGANYMAVARYNPDGSLDTTFGGGDGKVSPDFAAYPQEVVRTVAIDDAGNILVGGGAGTIGTMGYAVARLTPTGDVDTSFDTDGIVVTSLGQFGESVVNDLVVDGDGKIVVAGWDGSWPYDFSVLRYNDDGSLDSTFAFADFGTVDRVESVDLQSDGKIVVAGFTNTGSAGSFAVARYNTDGTLDTGFSGDGMATADRGTSDSFGASGAVIQSDGAIVVAGYSSTPSGEIDFALARFTTTGLLDAGFGSGGIVVSAVGSGNSAATDVTIQPDGRIIAVGNAGAQIALVRYSSSGSVDAFDTGEAITADFSGGTGSTGSAVEIQTDGKIIVGGTSSYTNKQNFGLARFIAQDDPPADASWPTLSVAKSGAGDGTVTGLGIDCGSTCSSRRARSTYGTLTATPAEGSEFAGWTGPCRTDVGDDANECTILLSSDLTVTAAFDEVEGTDPEVTEHARSLGFTKLGHRKNGGSLVARGILEAGGFAACTSSQNLSLQRKKDGSWTEVGFGSTRSDGAFRIVAPDRRGTYRVAAAEREASATDRCMAAQRTKRHRH